MSEPTDPRLLRLSPHDNVAAVTCTVEAGTEMLLEGRPIILTGRVFTGHKVAIAPIAAGEKVVKYGAPIGSARCPIQPGDPVHVHNLQSDYLPTYDREHSHEDDRDPRTLTSPAT